jgi:hypothetical protein
VCKKDALNEELIQAIKGKLLEDQNYVDLLMEILSMGKGAVYRRLRGEVDFTFYEVALICREFELSLDEIAGNTTKGKAVFSPDMSNAKDPFEYFYSIYKICMDVCLRIKDDQTARVSSVSNILPFVFHSRCKTLTKFRLYRMFHQTKETKEMRTMSEVILPEKLNDLLERLAVILPDMPVTDILWDSNVFLSLIQEIKYFCNMKLLSIGEVSAIKEELLVLLDRLEEIAYRGKVPKGVESCVYISNINFANSCTYMEKKDLHIGFIHTYVNDYIYSYSVELCRTQKYWIETLKRYSTLISRCDEMQRINYFCKQRGYVNSL